MPIPFPQPVLDDRAQRYKRNALAISVTGILLDILPNVTTTDLTVFGLNIGDSVWGVGLVLLAYHLLFFYPLAFARWSEFGSDLISDAGGTEPRFFFGGKRQIKEIALEKTYRRIRKIEGTHYLRSETEPPQNRAGINSVTYPKGYVVSGRWHILSFILLDILGTTVLAIWALRVALSQLR